MIHEAFLYRSDKDFAARLIPFLHDALAAGQGAIAVTTEARIALLRRGLGADADAVAFFDATRWYRRPGMALVAWRDTFDQQSRDGVEFVCAVGEVQFAGDQAAIRNWTRYESLLNRAFADRSAWIVCPYNTQSLPGEIVSEARRTHPTTSTTLPGRAPSPAHFEAHELGAPLVLADDRPKADERTRAEFSRGDDLREVRRNVRWEAQSAGLGVDVVDDLLLAVTELVEGSGQGRGAAGAVRTARQSGEWFCEVRFDSLAADTLPLNADDLGILIGRVVSDRVEVADDEGGQLVRFVFGKQSADPRQRIVTAASELFRINGVRPTGINAVIAHAGVAKATFYAYFQSKDDLIRFWLESPAARWFDQVRSEIELRTTTPAERLTTFFDVLGEWLMADDFRGCPFLNTATEFRNADRAFTQELADLTAEIEDYFRKAAAEAGFADPDGIAQELFLLVPGTITTATARASAEPARTARASAERIVASAVSAG